MTPTAPNPELRRLVDRLLEGELLARTEMARLEELLEAPKSLAYYLSVMSLEGDLPEALAMTEPVMHAPRSSRRFPTRLLIQAAAACLVFALGWQIGIHRPQPAMVAAAEKAQPPDTTRRITRVTGLMGVEWKKDLEPDLLALAVSPRRLAIESGLVELTYASGVRVTLEGPADFTVIDETSGKLDAGKLVASVPKGAEGFRVDYAKGNVVDLGTEFAMDARTDGAMELGVLDGKVNLNLPGEPPRPLLVNQAVLHGNDSAVPLQAIPLNREKFVRRMPSRDFRWDMTSLNPKTLEFDVTHLVWKGSSYRAIFKWIQGQDAILVRDVQLCLNGVPVVEDTHGGSTGVLVKVADNVYRLDLKSENFQRGRWTLRASIEGMPRSAVMSGPVQSQGILQFEEGLVTKAGPADFIGRWSYYNVGRHFIREFHPDGRVILTLDGVVQTQEFLDSVWMVEDGILKVSIPKLNTIEEHVLRDARTLIFTSQPYDNAVRVEDP